MKGTWQTTGGGGFDAGVLIQFAVIAVAAVCAVMIIMEFAWLIITVGVIATAVRLYLLYRRIVTIAAIEARGVLMREEQRAREVAELADRRRHELAVATASAPQVNITNTIDPVAMLEMAARMAAGQSQSWRAEPAPVSRREVGRL
jgi:hypothetical protein